MKLFRLQDANGRYVNCCAHGRHAEGENIQDRSTVVLFLASARAGLANKHPGKLWLYNHSHFIPQKRNVIVPQEMVVGSAELAQ